jgi:hypothetical protein
VRFDDRLLTVLNQPASDRHDAAVRWRQLVDLVARAGPNSASPVVAQALDSIRSEAANVDENLRAAAARAVAALPLPLGLLETFAADQLSVAAPVLAAATLEPAQWRALLGGAGEETRRFILTLHPELALPEADLTDTLVERATPPDRESAAPAPAAPMSSSLREVVARIERRRRAREAMQPRGDAGAAAAPAGAPALFRWECGPGGEIAWVEGAPRGALIGRSIARVQESDGDLLDEDVVRAFTMRAPFRDGMLRLAGDGLVAGEWRISGVPAFEPSDGRFAGYRGIALRDAPPAPAFQSPEILADPDSLRELVHEIKTPLNAIIGFAEIIDGQYLGPADRRYRERAAEIVAQARLLVGAIDDLDFAAKVHPQRLNAGAKVDLAELVERAAPALRSLASERGVELEIVTSQRMALAAVEPELADRLIFRLCSAVIESAEAGERLRLSPDQAGEQSRFSISRPAALRGVSDAQLFDPGEPDRAARSAAAFSSRLIRGLARVAGGDLVTSAAGLTLVFPRA